jgi:cbb3-type cytochrome c oxidase CcoQ subunit
MSYQDIEPFLQWSYLLALALSLYGLYGYVWYMYKSDYDGITDYEKLANLALDDNINSSTINTPKKKSKK